MKRFFNKSMSWVLSVVMVFGMVVVSSLTTSATQSKKDNFMPIQVDQCDPNAEIRSFLQY